jgi:hypothetical protein
MENTALAPLALAPDAMVRETMRANGEALTSYLRTIAPALPTVTLDREPDECITNDAGRTARLQIVIVAIVLVTAIVGAGLAFAIYRAANDGIIAVSAFLGGWGALALWFATRAQRTDVENAPETIREHGARFATETDAETRQILGRAYAVAVETDARARADMQRFQAQTAQARIDVDLARLAVQPRARGPLLPPRPVCGPVDDPSDDLAAPVAAPVATCSPPVAAPVPEEEAPTVPSVAAIVLHWLLSGMDSGKLAPGALVRERVPWSARSELLPATVKPEVERRLLAIDPPLFVATAGGQFRFGAHSRRTAAACVRNLLADL